VGHCSPRPSAARLSLEMRLTCSLQPSKPGAHAASNRLFAARATRRPLRTPPRALAARAGLVRPGSVTATGRRPRTPSPLGISALAVLGLPALAPVRRRPTPSSTFPTRLTSPRRNRRWRGPCLLCSGGSTGPGHGEAGCGLGGGVLEFGSTSTRGIVSAAVII